MQWRKQAPEFSERLNQLFPAGSDAKSLEEELIRQHFVLSGHCESDPSIHHAVLRDREGRFFTIETVAVASWKEDEQRKIIWTTGDVSFTGP